ncbi:cytochrome P450 [Jackrogersella minutella]|nr:cytochrome P450 [Jackrogersella minutella]
MVEDTLIISDVVRLIPTSIADTVGKFLASRLNSGNIVYDALDPLVAQRFEERDRAKLGIKVPEHKDCIQWIMANAPQEQAWTVQRAVHELIALWYGSVHITSVTACFAILDVLNNAEYAQPLRDEIENTGWKAFDRSSGKLFPLMDSFMKESSRLNPVECMSIRRKALKPFSFADGTTVQPGQWVCAPLASMSLDPNNHARPDEFHGFRFVHASDLEQSLSKTRPHGFQVPEGQRPSEFTDLEGIPLWGSGKLSCAGRYYASAVIKTTVALFLTKWDMQLAAPNARQHFTWRSWIYPYAGTKVILRPKSQKGEGF